MKEENILNETKQSLYGRTAWFYERAAHVFSGGQIRASKQWQIQWLKPSDRVLYVGAGNGEDVVMAAQQGVHVTVVELSKEMLLRLDLKLKELKLKGNVTLICGDAYDYQPDKAYDAVAANYFLNVFTEDTMQKMLVHLITLIKPTGLLLIADFAPAVKNPISRFFQKLYYFSAVTAFHLIAKNPYHPLYDYAGYLDVLGLKLSRDETFSLFGFGPRWYRSLMVVKQ
jgi:demethylmenaquinone methyltransferase/2-methoxy-6-polyprenyl-1,4-benzoquinol methylase